MSRHYEIVLEPSEWAVDDEVIQLRVRGSERVFLLPERTSRAARPASQARRVTQRESWLVGTASDCEIQLEDASGAIAEHHVLLMRHELCWLVLGLDDAPPFYVDGGQQPAAQLVPGTELRIGDITLVAESMAFVALRDFMKRLLGTRSSAADSALVQLRQAQTVHTPLVLRGDEALLPLARELHRRVYGEGRPFVVYQALHRMFREERDRAAPVFVDGAAALEAALGGTLCLLTSSLPPDCDRICEEYAEAFGTETQILLCDDACVLSEEEHDIISVPTMKNRPEELLSLVFELGGEAMRELGSRQPFAVEDVLTVLRHDASSFMGILESTRRFAALRKTGSLFAAAEILQMEPSALRRWIGPRELLWLRSDHAWDAN